MQGLVSMHGAQEEVVAELVVRNQALELVVRAGTLMFGRAFA